MHLLGYFIPNFCVENYINQGFGPKLCVIFTDQEYGQSIFSYSYTDSMKFLNSFIESMCLWWI